MANNKTPVYLLIALGWLCMTTISRCHIFLPLRLADKPIGELAVRFVQAAQKTLLNSDRTWVLKIGKTRLF